MTPTANLRKRGDSLSEQNKSSFPTYKGKPLVRSGDTIYYGSMKDKYVIKMDIKSKKKVGGLDVADKVTVQLMYTDPEIRTRKQIVKTSEKNGLYLALDIADAWQSNDPLNHGKKRERSAPTLFCALQP